MKAIEQRNNNNKKAIFRNGKLNFDKTFEDIIENELDFHGYGAAEIEVQQQSDDINPFKCELHQTLHDNKIEFCYRGSKIRDLIRNLQQNHSSFCNTINMCRINWFVFSNLAPRVSWLSDREEGALLHIKKPTCPGNEVVYLVTA